MSEPESQPEVYTSCEQTPEGPRWWGEVVLRCGEIDEKILHSTGLYPSHAEARKAARAWLREYQRNPPQPEGE